MFSIATKIAYKIVLAGFFILAVFAALNYQHLDGISDAVFLFLAAFIIAFAVASGDHITMPMKKFLTKAEQLSKGDFAGRFYIQSKDELGYLAKVFDKIAQHLGRNRFEVRSLEHAFDEKVKSITGLMGETIQALEEKVKNRAAEFKKIASEFELLKEQLRLRDTEISRLQQKVKAKKSKPKKSHA